jgi:hypothetical protein
VIHHSEVEVFRYLSSEIKMRHNSYYYETGYGSEGLKKTITQNLYAKPSLPVFGELPFRNELTDHLVETISGTKTDASSDPTETIFKDRITLIRSKIELILLQLYQRKRINRQVLYQIEQDSCGVQNLCFALPDGGYQMSPAKLSVERMRFDLQKEKRMEETSYFRDTGMLNKDLKDALIQYMEEVQKVSIINGDGAP